MKFNPIPKKSIAEAAILSRNENDALLAKPTMAGFEWSYTYWNGINWEEPVEMIK